MRSQVREFCGRKFIKIVLVFILCWCLIGCENKTTDIFYDQLPILKKEPLEEEEEGRVGIYVDVTPSMKGFLGMQEDSYKKIVEETRYMVCLDEIKEIIAEKYDEDEDADKGLIDYYRVDTPLWRTKDDVLQEAKTVNYYVKSEKIANEGLYSGVYEKIEHIEGDGEGYDSLCLTNALLNCKEDAFSVIITDFYENNREVAEVISALKENMNVPDEKTIGIIGIKSEYAGKVFDYDPKGVEYGIVESPITENDICYRQFFVIVIGSPKMVHQFCEQLYEEMNLDENDIKYTVFYEKDMYGLDYTNFNVCHTRSSETSFKFWPGGEVRINDEESMMVYDYQNTTGSDTDIVVSYKVEGVGLREELGKGMDSLIPPPGMGEKELIKVPYYIEKQKTSSWSGEEYVDENNFTEIFHIEYVYYSPEEQLLYVWLKIMDVKMPELPLKLSCQVCLDNEKDIVDGDNWAEEWNSVNNEKDYGKTRNLKKYFNTIEEQMPERNRVLLDFAFYISVK